MSYTDDPLPIAAETPTGIQEDAEWFSENNQRFWQVRRRLLDYVGVSGPVRLADGRRVGMFADGQNWDADAVAEIMPALISRVAVEFDCTQPQAERVLSLVLEELPDLTFEVKRSVDRAAASGVLRTGGEAAERLRPLRADRNKLSVK